jgi:hypothetical protein
MKIMMCFILLSFVLDSCNEANPRAVKAWINRSDTMVQKLILKEQPVLDSLCKIKSAEYYQAAYDSIYKKRVLEMQALLDSTKYHE